MPVPPLPPRFSKASFAKAITKPTTPFAMAKAIEAAKLVPRFAMLFATLLSMADNMLRFNVPYIKPKDRAEWEKAKAFSTHVLAAAYPDPSQPPPPSPWRVYTRPAILSEPGLHLYCEHCDSALQTHCSNASITQLVPGGTAILRTWQSLQHPGPFEPAIIQSIFVCPSCCSRDAIAATTVDSLPDTAKDAWTHDYCAKKNMQVLDEGKAALCYGVTFFHINTATNAVTCRKCKTALPDARPGAGTHAQHHSYLAGLCTNDQCTQATNNACCAAIHTAIVKTCMAFTPATNAHVQSLVNHSATNLINLGNVINCRRSSAGKKTTNPAADTAFAAISDIAGSSLHSWHAVNTILRAVTDYYEGASIHTKTTRMLLATIIDDLTNLATALQPSDHAATAANLAWNTVDLSLTTAKRGATTTPPLP
jgi:hypothetical protein